MKEMRPSSASLDASPFFARSFHHGELLLCLPSFGNVMSLLIPNLAPINMGIEELTALLEVLGEERDGNKLLGYVCRQLTPPGTKTILIVGSPASGRLSRQESSL
jgi:hypothetical protein